MLGASEKFRCELYGNPQSSKQLYRIGLTDSTEFLDVYDLSLQRVSQNGNYVAEWSELGVRLIFLGVFGTITYLSSFSFIKCILIFELGNSKIPQVLSESAGVLKI